MSIFTDESKREIVPVKVGLVGFAQGSFSDDKYTVYEKSSENFRNLSEDWGFELHVVEDLLMDRADVMRARKDIKEQNLDLILIQNSSFASGSLITLLGEGEADIVLWGLPETSSKGPLPLNSFCGTNMNMNILHKTGHDLPAGSWVYGNVDADTFQQGFALTLKTTRALRNLDGSRIGLIIDPALGFHGLDFDAKELREKFGVEVVRFPDYSQFIDLAGTFSASEVNAVMEFLKSKSVDAKCSGSTFEKSTRLYMAMRKIAKEYDLDAYAPRCWPELQDEYGIYPCAANSQLTDQGIMTSCEGDVMGAITMLILYYLEETPAMIMDLSDLDYADETVLFWHCGNAPQSFAHRGEYSQTDQFNYPGMGCVRDMIFKPQKSTAIRLTNGGSSGFILEGEFLKPEKESFDGSRGWFGNFSINGESVGLSGLIETIMGHGLEHHFTFIPGHVRPALIRFFEMLGVDTLGPKEPLID